MTKMYVMNFRWVVARPIILVVRCIQNAAHLSLGKVLITSVSYLGCEIDNKSSPSEL